MKIAIAGASCFIGKRLVQASINKDWEVVAVVREGSREIPYLSSLPNVSVVQCNMDDYGSLGSMTGAVDCFVYLTWDGTRGDARNEYERQKHNYECGMAAVRSVLDAGCGRVITAGSQAEYGLNGVVITEDMECSPNTQYGIWKLKFFEDAMHMCRMTGVHLKEPRFFSLYGPDDYDKTLIISMIDNMLHNRRCEMTECVQMWDYLYIDDAIAALILLCEQDCADGAYNFGSGDTRRLKDYVEELKDILGSSSELVYGAVPYPPTGMVSIQPNLDKLKQEIGWTPDISFRNGVLEIVQSRFDVFDIERR